MKKILFIDDNASLREVIAEALQLEGFQVFEADGGLMGVEIAKKQIPDLILCDIMMPKVDGYDVYNQLKAFPETSMIPFVFLTALAELSDVRKGMNHGADDYIIKPVSLDELLKTIYTRLEKSVGIDNLIEQRLNELRARIINTIPHEFLTPLNGILGMASIIHDEVYTLTKPDIKQMASIIETSGSRLHELIMSYLNYTRIAIKENSEINIVDISNLDNKIAVIANKLAQKYKRENDLILDLGTDEILMDWDDFEFSIKALLDNAFKFSTSGSAVSVSNTKIGNIVEICVTDLGRGFPIEKIADIGAFNQFYRERLEQQGSGLGLISTMLIAERYNGTLEVRRNEKGTTVLLKLPVAKNSRKDSNVLNQAQTN